MVEFRRAEHADLEAIVTLLAQDDLGAGREDASLPIAEPYERAFAAIDADPNQFLAVVTDGGTIIGTLQVTIIPNISRMGALRGQIEGVRVAATHQGQGIGKQAFEWAFEYCRSRGCVLVQLTTDKTRPAAHQFYEKLGFVATHVGFKKVL
ncbi:GNAT family N-acetyltransferase [Rhizobium sp. P44RR-XXIV]|uniref:GNAT family N-acetyltransferase n=1 Tax=Rhizobium sp. P44RR-XXIV TaxID=1921145 RepID=UPI000984B6CC|nr:GNAT family N-acetyltransferase [Rhizobium sp. P44RR-XXIV]TIX90281.1 GNAT family N-acetyltransferase [Rhizobium sp. P44RR-XXIV]